MVLADVLVAGVAGGGGGGWGWGGGSTMSPGYVLGYVLVLH